MKILRVVSELDFGGVEQVVANSIPELANRPGVDVGIVVLGKGGRAERKLIENGVLVFVFSQNPRIPNLKLLLRLWRFLREWQPDVIHCQGAEANFHGILTGSWAGVGNIIGEEIGIPNHHSYWKYIFRWVYTQAHTIIAISEAVKSCIVGLGEVGAEKVEVVYNPVKVESGDIGLENSAADVRFDLTLRTGKSVFFEEEIADLARNHQEDKPFVFVTTCRLVPVKNLERLIHAFWRLGQENPDRHIELWIVGEGPLRESLTDQANGLKVAEKIRFWGFQPDVSQFLRKADVFVLPSLSEGSSVSLVEAMAMGLPSIVTKVGGAVEILGESHSGILVDPLDEESIFDALSLCFDLPDSQKEEMGERARLEAKRFSVENYAKSLLAIYSSREK